MPFLPVDTAIVVEIGPCIDDTDFKTLETTIAYNAAGMSVDLIENSGTAITKTDITPTTAGANDWTHKGNAVYELEITAAQNNTEGTLRVVGVATGVLPFESPVYTVVPTEVYNSLVAGSDKLQTDLVQCGGATVPAGAIPNAAADAAGGLPVSDAGGLDLDTKLANTNEVTAARMAALTDWINGGRLDLLLDAIKVVTDGQAATGTGLSAIPWNAAWDAEVQSEVNDALVALGLDHLVGASVVGADVVDNSIIAYMVSKSATADWDSFLNTDDALEAIRDRGDAAWTTGAGGSDRLLMVDTTIATLASQTSFTLTAGSADDKAYENCTVVIEDVSTATQKAVGLCSAYTGATKTITLKYDPGIFTMAATDKVYILAENALKSTAQNRQLDVTATGAAGVDWANVENPGTAVDLAGTDIQLADTVTTLTGHTAQTGDSFARIRYLGPRGPGVFLDDAAANTNTVVGVDGVEDNPVSTIAAATTIAGSLGIQRIYLINDSVITLAQTYEGWEFVGIGEMMANTIDLGSQDVDNSCFKNVLISGAQGGTGRTQAKGCVLSAITGMEITALSCILPAGTLTLRDDCAFISCCSAVAGGGTPILDINSVASVNVYFRHYSGGLQVNNAVATTVMSYDCPTGQLVIGATCTSLTVHVRGNCTITDNGTTTSLTQDAAVNRTNINAECDTAISDAALATAANLATVDTVVDAIKVITDAIGATGTGLSAIPWNAAWDAEVESEVNDALDTAIAELGVATPTATPTLRTGLMLGYMVLRNLLKVQTSGTDALEVYNDAGAKIASKLLTDDGSDYAEAKMT